MNTTLMTTRADEINTAHHHAMTHADKAVEFARQAGELLLTVKHDLPHGEFVTWLESNINVTPRQAQRYMAAAQGKPLPVRKLASKTTPVSYLEVDDGEAVFITRQEDNWQDDIFIYPNSEHPGYFHYAFVSGEIGQGASCTYTKRGMSARGIGVMVSRDLPNWHDFEIERGEHLGYAKNPFMADDFVAALDAVAAPRLHKNIELARELTEQFIIDTHIRVKANEHLFKLLDGGDEHEVLPVPGETLHDIVDNLQMLLKLAMEPANKPIGKGYPLDAATLQREKIAMLVRTVLALLTTDKGAAK
jgi:hypothetical protein